MIQGNGNPFSNFFTSVSDTLSDLSKGVSTAYNTISNDIEDIFSGHNNNSLQNTDQVYINTQRQSTVPYNNVSFAPTDKSIIGRSESLAGERLKLVPPQQLKAAGEKNKSEFFKLLLPAALEAEKKYGVPASVTLAQAALESGWGKSPIGGYNIFGIKGKGPLGTVNVRTKEFMNGKWITINDNFAKYGNFYDAVMAHGKVFHAGYKGYQNGLNVYAKTGDDFAFIKAVGHTYATSPTYAADVQQIMRDYNLVNLSKNFYKI